MSSIDRLRAQLGDLADVALSALPEMFDQDSGLFSHKTVVVNGDGARRDGARRTARACANELLARFSPHGEVFSDSPRRRIPRRSLLERRFASFAAQVYPLHGLAARVELERLGVGTYADALALGLDWLTGKNELGVDLVGRDPAFINRCIQRDGSDADGIYGLPRSGYARAIGRSLAPVVGRDRIEEDRRGFEVLRECRSYHLGWLLYAHALVERAAAAADAST